MAFPNAGASFHFQQPQAFADAPFDIFEWHPHFQSCLRYFLDHAQHSGPVQAVADFLNIRLPFQKQSQAAYSSASSSSTPPALHSHSHHAFNPPAFSGIAGPGPSSLSSGVAAGKLPMTMLQSPSHHQAYASLVPYIRRLVATGFDNPAILHGFFGDDWVAGIGPLHEAERRNFLFAAKSDNWSKVKASYDMDDDQIIPFLKPLQNVSEEEIVGAESSWSEWLAMQDWMLGPRAPIDVGVGGQPRPAPPLHPNRSGVRIKREEL